MILLLLAVVAGSADVPPLPCAPGDLQPRATDATRQDRGVSPAVQAAEKELRALRGVEARYRRAADEAVATIYRRERDALRSRFLTRIEAAEVKEREQRTVAIATFRDHLTRRPESIGSADALFRLAELEFEDATDRYLVARRAWEAAVGRLESERAQGIAVGNDPEPPNPEYGRAIGTYRELLALHPAFPQRDGAQYMIAYCLGEMGDARGARDAFETLARAGLDSPFVAEAWLRVGEFHFERGEIPQAAAAYRKSAQHEDSPLFDKALYKLAWSRYLLASGKTSSSWSLAADTFARLVDEAPDSELRPEALQYLAAIYADHGGLPAVKAATSGRPWSDEVVQALARIWFEQGNWIDAAASYELVLDARPGDDDAPLWHNRWAQSLERSGQDLDAAKSREWLHERYGRGSDWQAAREGREALIARATALSEPALLSAAVWRHKYAQQTGEESDYVHAAGLYGEYLERYPGHPAAYDLAFYRGECLYFAGRFEAAAGAYQLVLEFTEDDRWHAEAAFSRVKALEVLAGPPLPSGSDPAPGIAELPIPVIDRELARAAERFTCIAPTDWRVPEALYRASQVYYATGRLDAARERAEAVVAAAPEDDLAADAATLIVDAWRLERNWPEVERTARRLAAIAPGRAETVRKATRASLERIALEAGFKIARARAAGGDHEGAAADFQALAERAPEWDEADRTFYAAGESWERTGLAAQAAQAFGRVAAVDPGSLLGRPAAFRRAVNLERILEVETAAKAYERFARDFAFDKDSQAASWNAAVLWEAAGRPATAALGFERYAREWKDSPDALQARFRAARAWLAAGRHAKAARAFDELAADPAAPGASTVEALAGLASAERARNRPAVVETARAMEEQRVLLRNGRSTPNSARAAAQAGMAWADGLRDRFRRATLDERPSRLEPSVRAKAGMLREAQDAYLSVAGLGDAEASTEALHKTGELYVELASQVKAARPRGEDADTVYDRFVAELDEKAATAFSNNLRAGDQGRVATVWTARSREALAAIDPDRYSPGRRVRVPVFDDEVWALPPMILPPDVLFAAADPRLRATRGAPQIDPRLRATRGAPQIDPRLRATRGAPQALPPAPPIPARDEAAVRALSDGVRLFERARAEGDREGLEGAEKAIAQAVTALSAEPSPALRGAGWLDLGLAREALGDLNGASVAWRAALEVSPPEKEEDGFTAWQSGATAGLVAVLARGGETAEAVELARTWLRAHPGDVLVRVNLSGALLARSDAPAALAMAIEALAGDARFFPAKQAAVAAALAIHRPELALFAAHQAASQAPDDPEAARLLGRTLRSARTTHTGRIEGRASGRELLVAAAGKAPDHAPLALAAGLAVLEDGDAARAVPLLERAAARTTSANAWIALSVARLRTANPAGAALAGERAVALSPADPAALRNLGVARFEAADYDGAAAAFGEYLEVTEGRRESEDPVSGWLKEARDREAAMPDGASP